MLLLTLLTELLLFVICFIGYNYCHRAIPVSVTAWMCFLRWTIRHWLIDSHERRSVVIERYVDRKHEQFRSINTPPMQRPLHTKSSSITRTQCTNHCITLPSPTFSYIVFDPFYLTQPYHNSDLLCPNPRAPTRRCKEVHPLHLSGTAGCWTYWFHLAGYWTYRSHPGLSGLHIFFKVSMVQTPPVQL